MERVGAVACSGGGVGGDGPKLSVDRCFHPFGGGDAAGDEPGARPASFESVEIAETDFEVPTRIGIGRTVVRDAVGLGDRGIAADRDKVIRHKMHRRVIAGKKVESPRDELVDGAMERTVRVRCIGMETCPDEFDVVAIDASAVAENHLVNRLFVEEFPKFSRQVAGAVGVCRHGCRA